VQPNDPTVHLRLGICYQQLGNDAKARRAYDRALELDPGYAEAWNNIGTLEQARRRFKPAVRAYKKAIETKPGLATPWKNLGNAYLALGRVQEAFEAYQEAFRLDPTILGPGPASGAGIDGARGFYPGSLAAVVTDRPSTCACAKGRASATARVAPTRLPRGRRGPALQGARAVGHWPYPAPLLRQQRS
jgi:Flp pilus assembly protein TadD